MCSFFHGTARTILSPDNCISLYQVKSLRQQSGSEQIGIIIIYII